VSGSLPWEVKGVPFIDLGKGEKKTSSKKKKKPFRATRGRPKDSRVVNNHRTSARFPRRSEEFTIIDPSSRERRVIERK